VAVFFGCDATSARDGHLLNVMAVFDAAPTPPQLEALVTTMCIVGFAEGELTCAALGKLGHQLDQVGWCDRLSEDEIDVLLERASERARAIAGPPHRAAR